MASRLLPNSAAGFTQFSKENPGCHLALLGPVRVESGIRKEEAERLKTAPFCRGSVGLQSRPDSTDRAAKGPVRLTVYVSLEGQPCDRLFEWTEPRQDGAAAQLSKSPRREQPVHIRKAGVPWLSRQYRQPSSSRILRLSKLKVSYQDQVI